MSKVTEFLDKVAADESAKAEFEAVIGVRKERELSDDDFQKIVGLSEKLGASVTLDEVKDFFSGNGRELSDEELAAVAGGSRGGSIRMINDRIIFCCPICGKQIDENFGRIVLNDPVSLDIWLKHEQGLKHLLKHHLWFEHPDLFGWTYAGEGDLNIARQKAEELIKTEWEKFMND